MIAQASETKKTTINLLSGQASLLAKILENYFQFKHLSLLFVLALFTMQTLTEFIQSHNNNN